MRRPYQEPSAVPGSVFDNLRPVLDVEVTLIAAPNARFDWNRPESRDEAIRAVVDQCNTLFSTEINGRVEHVAHTNFNQRGMTVHTIIVAPLSERLEAAVAQRLRSFESTLEIRLQTQLGWEHAAVTVQIETHPDYLRSSYGAAQTSVRPSQSINVFQPPGGSNAIAPVIVTVPSGGGGGDDKKKKRPRTGSTALAGLIGGLIVLGFALLVALTVGPLSDRIDGLYQSWQDSERLRAHEVGMRDQRIASLRSENARMQRTIDRLTPPRRTPPRRIEQPPPLLSDTDVVAPVASSSDGVIVAPAN
jgi:hypothetical protein